MAMNFTAQPRQLILPPPPGAVNGTLSTSSNKSSYQLLLTSVEAHEQDVLKPFEGAIYLVR
jgi:hypothetical protein